VFFRNEHPLTCSPVLLSRKRIQGRLDGNQCSNLLEPSWNPLLARKTHCRYSTSSGEISRHSCHLPFEDCRSSSTRVVLKNPTNTSRKITVRGHASIVSMPCKVEIVPSLRIPSDLSWIGCFGMYVHSLPPAPPIRINFVQDDISLSFDPLLSASPSSPPPPYSG
jgi:hypothetical protein